MEYHLILRPEGVAIILHKNGICDFGQKYMSQMARVFSKLASPHKTRVVSLGRQNTSPVPFNILRPEAFAIVLHKNGICDFGQKHMSQMARVFSKLTGPHEARVDHIRFTRISSHA